MVAGRGGVRVRGRLSVDGQTMWSWGVAATRPQWGGASSAAGARRALRGAAPALRIADGCAVGDWRVAWAARGDGGWGGGHRAGRAGGFTAWGSR